MKSEIEKNKRKLFCADSIYLPEYLRLLNIYFFCLKMDFMLNTPYLIYYFFTYMLTYMHQICLHAYILHAYMHRTHLLSSYCSYCYFHNTYVHDIYYIKFYCILYNNIAYNRYNKTVFSTH